MNDFTCQCAPGFAGRYCQMENDACHSDPCMPGQTQYCRNIPEIDSFVCECEEGYAHCPSPRGHHITKKRVLRYTGDHCEALLYECSRNPDVCHGGNCTQNTGPTGGMERGYQCQCPEGQFGPNCTQTMATHAGSRFHIQLVQFCQPAIHTGPLPEPW